jgi:hypothetical protein
VFCAIVVPDLVPSRHFQSDALLRKYIAQDPDILTTHSPSEIAS